MDQIAAFDGAFPAFVECERDSSGVERCANDGANDGVHALGIPSRCEDSDLWALGALCFAEFC